MALFNILFLVWAIAGIPIVFNAAYVLSHVRIKLHRDIDNQD